MLKENKIHYSGWSRTITRASFLNDEEITSHWEKLVKSVLDSERNKIAEREFSDIGFVEKNLIRAETFFSKFNPTRSYSKQWWKNNLEDAGHLVRLVFVKNLSFSIPATESLNAIADFVGNQNVYEYMAGSGYWAYLLQKELQVSITATDKHNTQYPVSQVPTFIPIKRKLVHKSTPPKTDAIMISWIPYEKKIANSLLKKMTSGQKLILIGEWRGGCCAHDSTFDILQEQFKDVGDYSLAKFSGLNDAMFFFLKK